MLVITDHFTKYAKAYPTKDQNAETVAKILWEHVIQQYGDPVRLIKMLINAVTLKENS